MTNPTTSKFTFDTEFSGNDDIFSLAAHNRQRKVYTQSDIAAIKAEARAEGLQEGQVRAMEALACAVREVKLSVERGLEHAEREIQCVREQSARIAFIAAQKIAHLAMLRLPAADVEETLREAMHQALGEARVTVRAAPNVIEALKSSIMGITQDEGYEGKVQLLPDLHLSGADCRIEWRGGGIERNTHFIETELAELLSRRFSQYSISTED